MIFKTDSERLQLRKLSKFRFLYDLKSAQVKWRCGGGRLGPTPADGGRLPSLTRSKRAFMVIVCGGDAHLWCRDRYGWPSSVTALQDHGLAHQGEPLVEARARSLICACVANHGRPCSAIPVITLSSIRTR